MNKTISAPKAAEQDIEEAMENIEAARKSQGMSINTGNPNRPMVLDFKEDMLTASIGYARINVAGVLALEGGITLQRRTMNDAEIYIAGIAMPMFIVTFRILAVGRMNLTYGSFDARFCHVWRANDGEERSDIMMIRFDPLA